MDDSVLIDRATRAYFRRFGKHADFPSDLSCVSTRGVVRLVNCNSELARYRHDAATDRLYFIPSRATVR